MPRQFPSIVWLGFFIGGLGWLGFARAAPTPDPAAVAAVLQADAARLTAMAEGDGAALAKLISDEVIFIHSDGRVEAKADYIRNMTAGDTAYANLKTSEVQARQVSSEVVVLAGAQQMRKKLGSSWSQINLRFLSVWRNEAGTWRMVAWQSMRPSGSSVVPSKI